MFSFVIPVLNEAAVLPGLLSDLRERFPDAELIVVDGGSRDASVAASLARADVVLIGEAGRARQMNLGAAVAQGEWLVFLHADTMPGFTEQGLLEAFSEARSESQSWGFCRVKLVGRPAGLSVISWAMNQRSRLSSVATGDQMLFIRRSMFARLGGYAGIPLMEDVEACKRWRQVQKPLVLPLSVSSSGRRWEQQGVVATITRMWALRLAFWLGVSPARLWRHYYGTAAVARGVPPGGSQKSIANRALNDEATPR